MNRSDCSGSSAFFGTSERGFLGVVAIFYFRISGLVLQPLACDAFDHVGCALFVIDFQRGAVVVPEIEFSEVSVQVALIAVLIDATHTTLEHAEVAFDGVGVDIGSGNHVLAHGVANGGVLGEVAQLLVVVARIVRHDACLFGDVGLDDRHNRIGLDVGDVDAADFTAALYERQNGMLVLVAAPWFGDALFGSEKRLIHFDNARAAISAHRRREAAGAHGFANSVANKPSRFQAELKRSAQLVRADALLTRRQQMEGLQPDAHGHMARLENGPDLDVEWLAAGVALIKSDPSGFAGHLGVALFLAAMRAHGTVRPDLGFNPSVGRFLIVKAFIRKDRHERFS